MFPEFYLFRHVCLLCMSERAAHIWTQQHKFGDISLNFREVRAYIWTKIHPYKCMNENFERSCLLVYFLKP